MAIVRLNQDHASRAPALPSAPPMKKYTIKDHNPQATLYKFMNNSFPIRVKTLAILFFVALMFGRWTVRKHQHDSKGPESQTLAGLKEARNEQIQQVQLWIRYRVHSDPVKLSVPVTLTWADVKHLIKKELAPAMDQISLLDIWLLHVTEGRILVTETVSSQYQNISADNPLIVFVNNFESRIDIKQRTSLPLRISAPLCIKGSFNSEGYKALYQILKDGANANDIEALRLDLCMSNLGVVSDNIERSQLDGFNQGLLASAYEYMFSH
ncbi:uncharacterized protein BYT42DRAFT_564518 [Radiomyces spectabilis]|uniref:uncharacterized protein n=1 Tax=Radiomyces spectabilis TaxID=64574 RepID=UPI0022200831|nr:uncharacterized protein BYT42DRAFT_564518 [Radiomyces spectabilis]KAI8385054.1 hypothetical protein BYT42DRAFT_564518 [Radiomyces spectabilis]